MFFLVSLNVPSGEFLIGENCVTNISTLASTEQCDQAPTIDQDICTADIVVYSHTDI